MNDRNRRGPQRKSDNNGPLFCSRCGGALMAQNTFSPTNVCRCKKVAAPAVKDVAHTPEDHSTVQEVAPTT
jgi:hypothetical protein